MDLTRAAILAGGPFNFGAGLDPPITRYNDLMTLTIIPNVNNQGAVTGWTLNPERLVVAQ